MEYISTQLTNTTGVAITKQMREIKLIYTTRRGLQGSGPVGINVFNLFNLFNYEADQPLGLVAVAVPLAGSAKEKRFNVTNIMFKSLLNANQCL